MGVPSPRLPVTVELVQRDPRAVQLPAPAAFDAVRSVAYLPDGTLTTGSFLGDDNGFVHTDPACGTDTTPLRQPPTIGQWLGIDGGLCFCIPVPEEVRISRDLLRAHQQFPVLPNVSSAQGPNMASFASRLMQARRYLEQLTGVLEAADQTATGTLGRARAVVASDLRRRSVDAEAALAALISSEQVRLGLQQMTVDRGDVVAAFDAYEPHRDDSATVDGDLADLAVAAFTIARTGDRVAVHAPKGLVQFVALYRKRGGYVEADANGTTDPKIVETALVLWEPNTSSPYSRWPAALQAAHRLR